MPTQRIIDPHIHLWDVYNTPRQVQPFVRIFGRHPPLAHWLSGKVFPKSTVDFFGPRDNVLANYLPPEYQADVAGRSLEGFVHVEAGWYARGPLGDVGETQWLEQLNTPLLKAVVGHANLQRGDAIAEVLEAHMNASPRFRGIRHSLAHHPNKRIWNACDIAGLMNDPNWRKGYAQLERFGLSFDAFVYHHQLDDLYTLAHDFPNITMILCHVGTPVAYAGSFAGQGESVRERGVVAGAWRASITKLATLPNVNIKISGLAMPIVGWGYHEATPPDAERVAEDYQPIVDFLIDSFGVDRCMFASNFPVDRVSMSWTTLYDAFERCVASRSAEERDTLFYGTASRVYRLNAL